MGLNIIIVILKLNIMSNTHTAPHIKNDNHFTEHVEKSTHVIEHELADLDRNSDKIHDLETLLKKIERKK